MLKRHVVLFSLIVFSFASSSLAETNLYQVFSLDDQFVVYSEDPKLAQEGAAIAEETRNLLFKELGWMNYSQYPTQVWFEKGRADIEFAVQRRQASWLKKVTLPVEENLNQVGLPREVIRLALFEFALSGESQVKIKPQEFPLWLVEGLRLKISRTLNKGKATTLFMNVEELFSQEEQFSNSVEQEQFARLSKEFLTFLQNLPNGQKKLKEYLQAMNSAQSRSETFFKVYSETFPDFQQLQFAWNISSPDEPKQERQEVILKYLDALDVE